MVTYSSVWNPIYDTQRRVGRRRRHHTTRRHDVVPSRRDVASSPLLLYTGDASRRASRRAVARRVVSSPSNTFFPLKVFPSVARRVAPSPVASCVASRNTSRNTRRDARRNTRRDASCAVPIRHTVFIEGVITVTFCRLSSCLPNKIFFYVIGYHKSSQIIFVY